MMDTRPAGSRVRDPIEAVLYFLLKNWLILLSLPVLAGVAAFAVAQGNPRTYTASIHIPAPPMPLAAFDDVWRGPSALSGATVATDGSVTVSFNAATEAEAREFVGAAQAAVRLVAADAVTDAVERQARFSDMGTRLLAQSPADRPDVLADQVLALATALQAGEAWTKSVGQLSQWSRRLDVQQVAVSSSNGSSMLVPLAAFGAFTLALAIAIVRWLLSRGRSGGRNA